MNKKRALSILVAAAMAAGTLVTSVPVYAEAASLHKEQPDKWSDTDSRRKKALTASSW